MVAIGIDTFTDLEYLQNTFPNGIIEGCMYTEAKNWR
jgi:hypothetical protein